MCSGRLPRVALPQEAVEEEKEVENGEEELLGRQRCHHCGEYFWDDQSHYSRSAECEVANEALAAGSSPPPRVRPPPNPLGQEAPDSGRQPASFHLSSLPADPSGCQPASLDAGVGIALPTPTKARGGDESQEDAPGLLGPTAETRPAEGPQPDDEKEKAPLSELGPLGQTPEECPRRKCQEQCEAAVLTCCGPEQCPAECACSSGHRGRHCCDNHGGDIHYIWLG